ncbi:MAG: hypothetical protein JOY56_07510 [Solirubrobacterales bacterium]|nr:hypothetical protein [Solirubrobacterales bacterium]MBV8944169.1 hypothetical protein [Solirubrobacterales bacterium]MBV9365993.1 hypothetical protein [Solirubrobacterales bacterium]MBV9684732.1 hypothetical protein [Solirubrobacterales bacterium]MBV9806019.1 hypothetical protein [Solirubrobacterales bacterium]
MLDFVLRPARSIIRVLNEDALKPLEETERETLDAVKAVDRVTGSIEHHVEVIETLATSVGPLTESVDRLNETMRDLVKMLAPLATAEREVAHTEQRLEQAEHFLGFRRHKKPAESESTPPEN